MLEIKRLAISGVLVMVMVFAVHVVGSLNNTTSAINGDGTTSGIDELTNTAVHLSKERNISFDEAKTRVTWQDKAEALNTELLSEIPDEVYGGMWIDEGTDRVKIGVLNDSGVSGNLHSDLYERVVNKGLEDATDFIEVEHSFEQLVNTKEEISKSFVENVGHGDWPLHFSIKPSQNKVIVGIAKDFNKMPEKYRAFMSELKRSYPGIVVLTEHDKPVQEAECNWWFCDSPLRGAVGLKGHANGYNGIWCTAGFNVVGNSGTRYVVTAGHCAPGGNGWATETYNYNTKKIGPIHGNLLDKSGTSKLDAMIIKIREDTYNWNVIGMIMTRSGTIGVNGVSPPSYNERYDITGSGSNDGLEGSRICISGAISSYYEGGSCGKIKEVDIDEEFCDINGANCNTVYKLTRASYCSRGGDSGAPVFRLGKAHGIHTASGPNETAQHPNPVCHESKYYTGMKPIIKGFDNNISIF
jgi:hypothetical protein